MCAVWEVSCVLRMNEGRNRSQHLSKNKNRIGHNMHDRCRLSKAKGPRDYPSVRPSTQDPTLQFLYSIPPHAESDSRLRAESASLKNNSALVLQTGPWMARQKFARSRAFDCSICSAVRGFVASIIIRFWGEEKYTWHGRSSLSPGSHALVRDSSALRDETGFHPAL
jgi:hypothetical protein